MNRAWRPRPWGWGVVVIRKLVEIPHLREEINTAVSSIPPSLKVSLTLFINKVEICGKYRSGDVGVWEGRGGDWVISEVWLSELPDRCDARCLLWFLFFEKGKIKGLFGRGHMGSLGRFPGSALPTAAKANGCDSARSTWPILQHPSLFISHFIRADRSMYTIVPYAFGGKHDGSYGRESNNNTTGESVRELKGDSPEP